MHKTARGTAQVETQRGLFYPSTQGGLFYSGLFYPYYAVQAFFLLTSLTFARHRLSPLAVFTSGAYFLHNGRR